MTSLRDLFRPNGMKLVLAVTLLVPVFLLLLLLSLFLSLVFGGGLKVYLADPIFLVLLAAVVSYVAGCIVDHSTGNRTLKVVVASLAALVSIVLGYLFVRIVMQPTVCDPVHIPTEQPTIITPATSPSETPMIFDPVHVPNACEQACRDAVQNAGTVTTRVAEKLDECLQNCYR